MFSHVRIRVQEYTLPKFFMTMSISETDGDNEVMININARYFHGQPVQGSVFVICGSQTQLLAGNLIEGTWTDTTDISSCFDDSSSDRIIRFSATVTDNDNDKNVVIKEFEPRAPNFQLIPLRPFFDETTKFVKIYIKGLMSEVAGDKIKGVYKCISTDAGYNGLNSSFLSQIEDTIDIELNPNCLVYIFQAHRSIGTQSTSSSDVFLALPSVTKIDEFNLSLINPPKKVIYEIGETFEASIPSLMSYVVICNRKDLFQQGTVSINGMLTFPIQNGMEGYCILHAFGSALNQKRLNQICGYFL
jgi:hypothetical protein